MWEQAFDMLEQADRLHRQFFQLSREGAAGGAVAALNAGVDLILVSYDPDQYFYVMYALLAAERAGLLNPAMLERSQSRLRRARLTDWPVIN